MRARPRAHHQSVQRREAHGGRDALAVADRRHAGAVAEVRDDQAAWNAAGDGGQGLQDRFVGQSMEAIAPQAGLPEFFRQREAGGDLRLGGMESSIEARDLGQGREQCLQRFDRRDIVRLVQRRQRDQRRQLLQRRAVDAHRCRKACAAMHHAMSGAEPVLRARGDVQPRDQQLQRIAVVPQRIGLAPIQRLPAGISDCQPGFALADARELALQLQPRLAIGRDKPRTSGSRSRH